MTVPASANPDVGAPFVDIDEWRDTPRRHRYVHGGFENTNTRFSFYFPPEESYSGRFFQYLEGGAGGHENLLAAGGYGDAMSMDWIFNLAFGELGGYLVESNQGHFTGEGLGFESDYWLYGASADSAVFARSIAAEMYGAEPHHGYVWGVSGGGARSGQCLENRPDVWQGGAPHAGIGQNTQWSPWALSWLVGRDKWPDIIDAVEPGGSGDPFDGLSHVQREALAEMYRRGFPRGGENQLAPFTAWAFPFYAMLDHDPEYFDDFWNKPGYLGHDAPEVVERLVIAQDATVTRVVPASEVDNLWAQMFVRLATAGAGGNADLTWGIEIDVEDPDRLFMAEMAITSGRVAGRDLLISGVDNGVLSPFVERTPGIFAEVEVGDTVRVDNRRFVAFCFYHRYTTLEFGAEPSRVQAELAPWSVDGLAVYPQRTGRPASMAAPTAYKARLESKMIYVQPTHDTQVWPTTIYPYDRMMRENMGDKVGDHYRLWFCENSPHGTPEFLGPALTSEKDPGIWRSRLVSYDGVTAQALRDLVPWVEEGVAPPSYTGVELSADNALVLADSASERGGIQPVVSATANGAARAEVRVGDTVEFTVSAETPADGGTIVSAAWDFAGTGQFEPASLDGETTQLELTTTHTYTAPGTYFASVHVGAHRHGLKGEGPTVDNLARVRVVVSD